MALKASGLDGEIRDGRHLNRSGLLRGHRLFRRRLSRELSALHGARPDQLSTGVGADQHACSRRRRRRRGLYLRGPLDAIDFRKPARMDDAEIMTAPLEVKGASIVLHSG
jgi:hypothetical protein